MIETNAQKKYVWLTINWWKLYLQSIEGHPLIMSTRRKGLEKNRLRIRMYPDA